MRVKVLVTRDTSESTCVEVELRDHLSIREPAGIARAVALAIYRAEHDPTLVWTPDGHADEPYWCEDPATIIPVKEGGDK